MFSIIEGAIAITRCRGIYRQLKMYDRNGRIYIGWSNGFISVHKGAGKITTSLPDVTVDEYKLPFKEIFTKVGAMVTEAFVEEYQTAAEVNRSTLANPKGK